VTTIDFIYDRDCPNTDDARAALRAALRLAGLPERWREWDRAAAGTPDRLRRYGSPTILVNERDVAGVRPATAPSCRVYTDVAGRARGVPPIDAIRRALTGAAGHSGGGGLLSALPAIGVALLPKLTCAACWPAYAALLGAMGINFVDYTPWLFPALTLLLIVTVASLAWRARRGRGYGPFWLGALASAGILAGKFIFQSDPATVVGGAVLLAAAGWNAWPRRSVVPSCPACASTIHNPETGGKP
jgi:hypothetical protein